MAYRLKGLIFENYKPFDDCEAVDIRASYLCTYNEASRAPYFLISSRRLINEP